LPPTHGYPRPQFRRGNWISLNGAWDFALDPDARWSVPQQVKWEQTIIVPFAPETPASGIHNASFFQTCWYRRYFDRPALKPGERLILHFGAVDYSATVCVGGSIAIRHHGGYTPFSIDITEISKEGREEIIVRAEDDPQDLAKPRGKQDWLLEPHSIWYPRTSGIWQTVWLETIPATSIGLIRWTPNLELWEIGLEAQVHGILREGLRLGLKLRVGDLVVANDTYEIVSGEVTRRIALSDPGIDDHRNELLWSPRSPTLIDADIELWGARGELIDKVTSYTALRSIAIQGDRILLNGRPFPLRMVLDQGYWPESGLTAPNDSALRRDVELAREMGFNGVRKHQKIEDPRYLYWADKLGLVVWEEMPSAYRFTRTSIERLIGEWTKVIERDYSHPCIIAWVPFNESWGVPNLPELQTQRHYLHGVYHLTKTLDPTRPVVGNDGWESVATDIIGIHDYDHRPEKLALRYEAEESVLQVFKRERPGGRVLALEGHAGQPVILSEFGGIAFSEDDTVTWGHSRASSSEQFGEKYKNLLSIIRNLPLLSGFCYTQFSDTYQETNGLLYADRTPKFPMEEIATATRGERTRQQEIAEQQWRNRLMKYQRHGREGDE